MAVSTSFCGQTETERERILQRRSSMSAHKVRPLYTTPMYSDGGKLLQKNISFYLQLSHFSPHSLCNSKKYFIYSTACLFSSKIC